MSCPTQYCINNTGLGYDDNYTSGGTYNSNPYYVGSSSGYVIYFSISSNSWCLSNALGGTCLLSGKSPCTSVCPDLCDEIFFSGVCPTPTPSPTTNCDTFNFDAIFDCLYEPTPTPTPTSSLTPTPTPTPTVTNFCSIVGIGASITGVTPTPTSTLTPTPTKTPSVTRPFNFSGDVTFTPTDTTIKCPSSKQFQDCYNGEMYYTTNPIVNPSSGETTQFMIFKANVNGVSKCISYVGINNQVIGKDNITLVQGPIGLSNLGECALCVPDPIPSPTPSITPTNTVTPTITPSATLPPNQYYVLKKCFNEIQYIIQTIAPITTVPGNVIGNQITKECWEFMYVSSSYPTLPLGAVGTYINGNYFPNTGVTVFTNTESLSACENCASNPSE